MSYGNQERGQNVDISRTSRPPIRYDGEAPVWKHEPIRVASLGSLMGILSQAVVAQVASPKVYYFLNDHLGTPLLVTDGSNKVVWEGRYDPFGDCIVHPFSTIENNFRFPGQYYDGETGLHYNYHRYYLPRTGRYVTPDPIGLDGGFNLYRYALNNPTSLVDPSALFAIVIKESGGRKGPTYGAAITVISNSGQTVSVPGSSWPNPTSPAPGVAEGTYEAVYSPTGQRGREPGVRLENGNRVPTLGPNPAQNNQPFATGINIHIGYSDSCRGSAGCITIDPKQATQVWIILEPGETGTVTIIRSTELSDPCE